MTIFLIIIGVIFLMCCVLFTIEIKIAPFIDENKPFLWDDFEEENHYSKIFCKNCKFFDGTAMCLNEHNFGQISHGKIKSCEEKSLFEVK